MRQNLRHLFSMLTMLLFHCCFFSFSSIDCSISPLHFSVVPTFWTFESQSIVEADLGVTLQLDCGIKANPLTVDNVTWTKVAGPTFPLTETKSQTHSNSSITYILNTLDLSTANKDDYGKYECIGANHLGQVSDSVWVYVKCKFL